MSMKEMKAKLPPMWNAYIFAVVMLLFIGSVLSIEGIFNIELGDGHWLLIGSAGTALSGSLNRVVKYYTNGDE